MSKSTTTRSPSLPPLSREERIFSARLSATMQPPISLPLIAAALKDARRAGLDWRKVYEAVVAARDPQWPEAPAIEVVAPE